MLTTRTYRTPFLLALILVAVFAWTGRTPALAACTPGAPDKPDLGFVDSNCDGIDGDKANAIFVATTGSDANDGSYGHPMATVTAAANAGLASGKDVYVAAGTYTGKVSLISAAGHIGIYGGYDPSTWGRSAANMTTLKNGPDIVTDSVPGIVLQLLTLQGDPNAVTSTSYGVRAWGNGQIALSHVTVEPAAGVPGADGADASQTPPAQAPKGGQGVGNPNCDPQKLKGTFDPGALGGSAPGLLSGGRGGWWGEPSGYPWAGSDGQSDPSVPGVGGGIGGEEYWSGGLGSPGKPGTGGMPGYADLNIGTVIYAAMSGSTGGNGTRGAGGGGGGMATDTCIPGSGGGAGGRPGVGGAGGKGGGGSIGVFAGQGSHVLVIDGSVIHAADGGKGGSGGLGQPGGEGGDGGDPGIDIYDNDGDQGTSGGHGGKGGPGAQGGGAAGGASIGVLAVNASEYVSPDSTITVGKGGKNGIGGYNGWVGAAQPTAQVTAAGGSIPATGDFDGDGIADNTDACPIQAGKGDGCPKESPSAPGGGSPGAGAPGGGSAGSGSAGSAGAVTPVSVLPAQACVAKRVIRIKINARKAHLRSARLTLDGQKVKLHKGKKRWTAKLDLRHSKRTRHTLTIRGRLRNGHKFKQTRHYRTCAS